MSDEVIVGLDIGSCSIRVAVGEIEENSEGKKSIVISNVFEKPTKGVRNGIIVNIEEVASIIHDVIEQAEVSACLSITGVVAGVGGNVISSMNANGGVAITPSGRQITENDKSRVFEAATAIQKQTGTQTIHVIPGYFTVLPEGTGSKLRTKTPVGMTGVRLDVDVHIVTVTSTTLQSLTNCLNRSNLMLDLAMLKTLAIAGTIMREDEKELGSIIIDLGGGTTDIIVVVEGTPVFTASIPVGGNLVTSDIGVMLGIMKSQAEDVKIKHGCCWKPLSQSEDTEIAVPGSGGSAPIQFLRSELCEVIQPRMEEIFQMVYDEISRNAKISSLSGNIILTGGGALLPGVEDLAKYVFQTGSVRIGRPGNFGGIREKYKGPEWSTAVGLVVSSFNDGSLSKKTAKTSKFGSKAGKEKSSRNGSEPSFWKRIINTMF